MRALILALCFLVVALASPAAAAPFGRGNVVVYRVGDDSTALSAAAHPVFLDEYNQNGVLIQSLPMPTVVSGTHRRLTASGESSAVEGFVHRSLLGDYLTLPGYDAAVGTSGVAATGSAAINRVVARVRYDGTISTETRLNSAFSGGSISGAWSSNNTDFYVTGAGSSGGVWFVNYQFGTASAPPNPSNLRALRLTTTPAICRGVGLYPKLNESDTNVLNSPQLYVSTGTGTGSNRLWKVGDWLPVTTGQMASAFPGSPLSTGTVNAFVLLDLNPTVTGPDTLYAAEEGGAVYKFCLVGGSFVPKGSAALAGARGLTGWTTSTGVRLFATTTSGLHRLDDTSGFDKTLTAGFTALVTMPVDSKRLFRGVSLTPNGTTAVGLDAFTATATPGGTLLQWRTGWEAGHLGFHLYRESGGLRTRLNPELLAGGALSARASRAGHAYAFLDPDPVPAAYYLEDVDLSGHTTLHGPFYPTVETGLRARRFLAPPALAGLTPPAGAAETGVFTGPLSRVAAPAVFTPTGLTLGRFAPARAGAAGAPAVAPGLAPGLPVDPTPRGAALAARPALKLPVRAEGWYRLSGAQLYAAGLRTLLTPETTAPNPDGGDLTLPGDGALTEPLALSRLLRLYVAGREVAVRVTGAADGRFDPEDTLEFYGLGVDTPSTDLRPYWLLLGPAAGLRLPTVAAARQPDGPPCFPETVERRERRVYFSALQNGPESNFFGAVVTRTTTTQSLALPDPAPAASPAAQAVGASLEVRLQGVTESPAAPDHRVAVSLNGTRLGEVVWDGKTRGSARFPLPLSLLRAGENTVSLWAEGGPTDVSLVEALRLRYPRQLRAVGDRLRFSSGAGRRVRVGGFTTPAARLLDLTDPERPRELPVRALPEGAAWTVEADVPASPAGERLLLALPAAAGAAPGPVTLNRPSRWGTGAPAADVVYLAPGSLHGALAPLVALRQAEGWRAAVVDLEDVYDEWAYGEAGPGAVRAFLAWAGTRWSRRPRAVVLVGDASLDPRGYLGAGQWDLVPTLLVDAGGMETMSDSGLADRDGDGVADLAVGRLPARSAAGVEVLVGKLRAYAARPASGGSPTSRGAVAAADVNDESDFEGASRSAAAALGGPVAAVSRRTSGSGALAAALGGDPAAVSYQGHGNVDLWRGGLLTNAGARGLTNGAAGPVWVLGTCLNGYFGDPSLECVGEALLGNPGGGGVAVVASAGQCGPGAQAAVAAGVLRRLGQGQPVGEALREALAGVGDGDVRATYLLLGDPLLRLR